MHRPCGYSMRIVARLVTNRTRTKFGLVQEMASSATACAAVSSRAKNSATLPSLSV
jgi:hypothetical protein